MMWRLTEDSDEVTLKTATASVETEIIRITVPDTYSFLIAATVPLDLTLESTAPAALTDSAEITVYVARPDGRDQKFLGRFFYREVANADIYDRNKVFYLRLDQALKLPERWMLIFKVNDSVVASSTRTIMQLDVHKVQV